MALLETVKLKNANSDLINPSTTENQVILQDLISTLQELCQRLSFLSSCKNSGNEALRVIPINTANAASTIATIASVTAVASVTASTVTNFGTGIPAKEHADDMNNLVATVANIQNVTIT